MTKLTNWTNAGPGLKRIMQSNNVTVQAVAVSTGVARSTLYRILNGRADLRLSTLVDIAETLGYEVQVVIKGKEDPS